MAERLFTLRTNLGQLNVVFRRGYLDKLNAAQRGILSEALRDAADGVRQRAIHNVSGMPFGFEGGRFIVNTRTGALKGSIQMEWPYQDWMTARVFVNGTVTMPGRRPDGSLSKPRPVSQYAAAIEYGHGVIDLKRFMQGKVVPFFAALDENASGPYMATGLKPVTGSPLDEFNKARYWTPKTNKRTVGGLLHPPMIFEKKGVPTIRHGHGTYFIAFRTVGKEGWVIPAAKPRPFMRGALYSSRNQTREILGQAMANMITGKHRPPRRRD